MQRFPNSIFDSIGKHNLTVGRYLGWGKAVTSSQTLVNTLSDLWCNLLRRTRITTTFYFLEEKSVCTGPILENEGMHAIFQKKGKKNV